MKAMILAAGLGTRLRPYSLVRPKPLFPVLDRPLLHHVLDQLRGCGATDMVVNAHHLQEQIVRELRGEKDVSLQREARELGTGGGLRLAMPFFTPEPFLAVNGDIVHDLDLAAVYAGHCTSGADVTMVVHDCPRFNSVLVSDRDRIRAFSGHGEDSDDRLLAFTGIQVINPQVLSRIPEGVFFNIIDCYAALLKEGGHIRAQRVSGHFWTDMGTPADYLGLHQSLLLDNRLSGLLPVSGNRPFFLGREVSLGLGVAFHDWAVVGSHAQIGANCSLTRVVVWDGARVAPGTVLCDCIVS